MRHPPRTPSIHGAGRATSAGAAAFVAVLLSVGMVARGPGALDRYDLDEPASETRLPRRLTEVSGLALTPDGRLFAHHDESAEIFQVDPASGNVLARFHVGMGVAGDFEGLAWTDDRFFLVDSRGDLLEFYEGADGTRVGYRRTRTGLGRVCEVEGLAWDPEARRLLLPCKTARHRELEDQLVVFAFSLESRTVASAPVVRVPWDDLDELGLRRFRPSAIDVHPASGTLLLASAQDEAVLELAADGRPLSAQRLGRRRFPQVEGLAVAADGALYLASEGQGGRGRLATFLPDREGGGP